MIFARKTFSRFFEGGGATASWPPSPTPMGGVITRIIVTKSEYAEISQICQSFRGSSVRVECLIIQCFCFNVIRIQ